MDSPTRIVRDVTAIGRRVRNAVNPVTTALTRAWCHSALRRRMLRLDRRSPVALPFPSTDATINRCVGTTGSTSTKTSPPAAPEDILS